MYFLRLKSHRALSFAMAKEIERKFLVSSSAWRASVEGVIRIRQFYLVAARDRTVRIRISDENAATLTLKFPSEERGREEFEYPVPLADAEEMHAFAFGRTIEKTRYHVRHEGYLYEVDVFGGALAGLVIVELETSDIVPTERLPQWVGREVTQDGRYYNASLALGDLPEFAT
jgi:CYTH domain-containing protein